MIGAPPETEVLTVSSTISPVRTVLNPRILLWTKDGENPVFADPSLRDTGETALRHCSFPVRYSLPQDPYEDLLLGCYVTKDRSLLNRSDAVLFDASTINATLLPRFRDPRQVWVFYTHRDTAPTTLIGFTSAFEFNWTMAQRTDADVVIPFGNWTLSDKPASRDYPKKLPRKDRTALFFASDCDGKKNYVLKGVLRALEVRLVRSCGVS
ncbi:alpha-(1,3)-fucosyltransferase fut-5-like [Rhipicephalus sanguineus]|uniref:alpha-(1,3)-fucosyltransferase fut-5-like n=1 Tax=Rhipicephalus sanguineus TaxID=34632 RepID=UPI0020C4FC1D|nr:alpha-(1,3)-fucosyltransferase fut-5-like [Rhipicephalus sanguineus]